MSMFFFCFVWLMVAVAQAQFNFLGMNDSQSGVLQLIFVELSEPEPDDPGPADHRVQTAETRQHVHPIDFHSVMIRAFYAIRKATSGDCEKSAAAQRPASRHPRRRTLTGQNLTGRISSMIGHLVSLTNLCV
jgi:hypothetical protein